MVADLGAPEGVQARESESSRFAPTPPGRRGRKTARLHDPAMDAGEAGAGAGVMGATTAAEPADPAYETQPASGQARRGVSRWAMAAGVAAAAILAGVGWYAASRAHHPAGLAVLTPGASREPTTLPTTTSPRAGPLPITRVSAQSVDAAREPETSTDAARHGRRRPNHVRPPDAENAMTSGMNTSASAPIIQGAPIAAPTSPTGAFTHLTPLAGTTSPVPPASTASASSADPGSSPAATPPPVRTPGR